jgi:serine/threonine protein kinase
MAPEIATSCGQINEKVDVYSFGIVVFEIMSERKREDFSQNFPTEEKHLRHWVCAILQ